MDRRHQRWRKPQAVCSTNALGIRGSRGFWEISVWDFENRRLSSFLILDLVAAGGRAVKLGSKGIHDGRDHADGAGKPSAATL
jgi:hypothetical protein